MKVLLDENLPKKLTYDLLEHEVFTVREMQWNGKKNGELLALMKQQQFDILLTFDKNMQYQQNFSQYTLSIILLQARSNSYATLKMLMPFVRSALQRQLPSGVTVIR
jgi:predicted nuclease of predicted toxin-antitoxin system